MSAPLFRYFHSEELPRGGTDNRLWERPFIHNTPVYKLVHTRDKIGAPDLVTNLYHKLEEVHLRTLPSLYNSIWPIVSKEIVNSILYWLLFLHRFSSFSYTLRPTSFIFCGSGIPPLLKDTKSLSHLCVDVTPTHNLYYELHFLHPSLIEYLTDHPVPFTIPNLNTGTVLTTT